MRVSYYDQFDETVYSEVLDNGLLVKILPKRGFHKTYALFKTNYGSIDNHFCRQGEEAHQLPDGIAHFLEHKMFEKEGYDVFEIFGKFGASANAYTSFDKTAYLFSTSDYLKENLETLLDFVQDPYFTEKTVEKEKGIVAQEIRMYEDDPSWSLHFGLLKNLFPHHPASVDIAGTVESIQKITADMLYLAYETFYHPSQMTLSIVGNCQPEKTMEWIRENQAKKSFSPIRKVERLLPDPTSQTLLPERQEIADLSKDKLAIGIRSPRPQNRDLTDAKFELKMQLLNNLIFGQTSDLYLDLYKQGMVDDSFSAGYSMNRSFDYYAVSTDTDRLNESKGAIRDILIGGRYQSELTPEKFALVKKRMLGNQIGLLNSVEYLASTLHVPFDNKLSLFDILALTDEISLEDLQDLGKAFFLEENLSVFELKADIS